MTLRPLTTHAELFEASGHDPLVRWEIPDPLPAPAHALGRAVAIARRTHLGRRSLTVIGPDEDALGLVREAAATGLLASAGNLSVEQSVFAEVSAIVPLGGGNDWEWMHTTTPPPATSAEDRVVALTEADLPQIQALLDAANPRTDARPFQTPGQRWVGVRQGDSLLAVGCDDSSTFLAPVLNGITVDPTTRGQGLGLAVTARLTRDAVDRAGVCVLGMYSDNAVGRRLYVGLGYRIDHRFSSRVLLG